MWSIQTGSGSLSLEIKQLWPKKSALCHMLSLWGVKLSRWRCSLGTSLATRPGGLTCKLWGCHNGVADECVLRCVAASVGGLDSTRRFDVHSSCIFKDLETVYFIVKGKKAGCVRVGACVHIALRLLNRLHAVLNTVPLSASQGRDFLIFCSW